MYICWGPKLGLDGIKISDLPQQYYALRRWDGARPAAIAALRTALATDPFAADLRPLLARMLSEAGDAESARQEMAIVEQNALDQAINRTQRLNRQPR